VYSGKKNMLRSVGSNFQSPLDSLQVYLTAPEGSKNASCLAEMFDSQGELTDSRVVLFSVNATVTDSLSVSDGTRESLTGGDSNSMTCTQRCGNAFALLCFYLKGCKSELAKAIGLIFFLMFVGAHICDRPECSMQACHAARTCLQLTACALQNTSFMRD
jgi:hypothetical protein